MRSAPSNSIRTAAAIVVVSAIVVAAIWLVDREAVGRTFWGVSELGTRVEFRDVFFLDENRGWVVGGDISVEGGILGSTTDGGRTWRFRSGVAKPSRRSTTFHLNAIWFLDPLRGFIVGDGFLILRTEDGGEHWRPVPSNKRVWAHLREIHFVDDRHGWALGEGGLVKTTDGGKTWKTPLPLDPEQERRSQVRGRALWFADRSRGCLVGGAGKLQITTDGGGSWQRIIPPGGQDQPDLWGLDFADSRFGWAVGEGGSIFHTADGGWTWVRQTSGVEDTLMDVDFVDTFHGWAVGFEREKGTSVVLVTEDGGRTWREETRVESEGLRALFALDRRHLWAVGGQQRRSERDGAQKFLRYEGLEED